MHSALSCTGAPGLIISGRYGLLTNPQEIWSHAFNQQISPKARNILLCLYTQDGFCELFEFAPLWASFNTFTASKYIRTANPNGYQSALKGLDNAVVTYRHRRIVFLNPSIGEMVAAEIAEYSEHALDLIAAAQRFRQIARVAELSQQPRKAAIDDALATHVQTLVESVTRLLRTPHLRWDTNEQGEQIGSCIDWPFEQRIAYIGKIADIFQLASLREFFESEMHDLIARYARRGSISARPRCSLRRWTDVRSLRRRTARRSTERSRT